MLNKANIPMTAFANWYFDTYRTYPDFTDEPHISEAIAQFHQVYDQALLLVVNEWEGSC